MSAPRTLAPSYLTADERIRLSAHPFQPGDAPLGYMDVSHTQLSIARYCGGITVQGHHYTYFPATDELWRDRRRLPSDGAAIHWD